jgi:predicted hydrocarbon binding protein
MQKKKTRVSRKVRRARPRERSDAPLYDVPDSHTSYETALLKSISAGHRGAGVSRHALMFCSLMANATPSMRTLNYRHGVAVGRSLYQICAQRRGYALYEESVDDVVSFFERAGYGRITYRVLPSAVTIEMHDMLRLSLGMNTHLFEAGIMSGFLTAARGQLTNVVELSCSNNSAGSCEFRTSASIPDSGTPEINSVFGAFVDDVSRRVSSNECRDTGISDEYYALSSLVLLDSKYFGEMKVIAGYLGGMLASSLRMEKMPPKRILEAVERSVGLLGMGVTGIKTSGSFDFELRFSKLHSRREFTELSVAFLNGLLRNASKGAGMSAKCLIHNNTYTVLLSRSKQGKRVH